MIAIVGDLHIKQTVASRIDNYFETCLNKLEQITNKYNNIIFLGDVFDAPTMSLNYLNLFYRFLMDAKIKKGVKFYSIIGNHDIYNEREDSLNKTSLGMCSITDVIQVILPNVPTVIEGKTFHTSFVNLKKAKEHLKDARFNKEDILLLHHSFEDMNEGLFFTDLKDVGCSKIFFGHEHNAFEKGSLDCVNFTAYRCGALLRTSSIYYNLTRDIYYFGLKGDEVVIESIECESSDKIFKYDAINKGNLKKKEFLSNINAVIRKYTNNVSNQEVYCLRTILEDLKAPLPTVEYIKSIYDKVGEKFD